MKYKTVLFMMVALALCNVSCSKDEGKDGVNAADSQSTAAAESPIFKQELLAGISGNLDDYRGREDFAISEVIIDSREMGKNAPDHYMAVENDDIIVGFWPGYQDDDTISYQVKFIDIKRATDTYVLGQFIGLTPEEIFSRFTPPADYVESAEGENHIVYFSADGKQMVNFWLEDNVVIRAAFGYM
ncbi:hypothetical protein AGMMS50267_04220 [Spirochaetia bacterium]|nr:hypothetical protein AGMMS50267_04220 [Spirochaetia bacterium]